MSNRLRPLRADRWSGTSNALDTTKLNGDSAKAKPRAIALQAKPNERPVSEIRNPR
jgi:hypothetical protein